MRVSGGCLQELAGHGEAACDYFNGANQEDAMDTDGDEYATWPAVLQVSGRPPPLPLAAVADRLLTVPPCRIWPAPTGEWANWRKMPHWRPTCRSQVSASPPTSRQPRCCGRSCRPRQRSEEPIHLARSLAALGSCVAYLREHLIDSVTVSLKNFHKFVPYDEGGTLAAGARGPRYMVLDSNSLANLEIMIDETGEGASHSNSLDWMNSGALAAVALMLCYCTVKGSLLGHLDHCVTPGGKRLFRKWLQVRTRPTERSVLLNNTAVAQSLITAAPPSHPHRHRSTRLSRSRRGWIPSQS